jgi:uncharacterized membrane protein
MGKAKRNYFLGIRTPWTLQSDRVWNETHKAGAIGFKIIAALLLLNVFFVHYYVYVLLATMIGYSLYLFYYSYRLFQKYERK